MKIKIKYLLIFFVVYCGNSFAATLSVKEISYQEFELILEHDQALEIVQAQASMHQSAVQLCNGKNPIFGKYEFKSSEPVSKDNGQTIFTFTQRISCSEEEYSTPAHVKFNLSREQEKLLSDHARKYTNIYLSAKNQGKYNDAYQMLTLGNKSTSAFGEWKAREEEYQAVAGDFVNRNIWKITVYDNPENSSQPGIYIATDYESKFQNVPLYCGYVIWFIDEPDSTDFKVMREEHGYIDSKIYNKISKQELKDIKSKFGCDPS